MPSCEKIMHDTINQHNRLLRAAIVFVECVCNDTTLTKCNAHMYSKIPDLI